MVHTDKRLSDCLRGAERAALTRYAEWQDGEDMGLGDEVAEWRDVVAEWRYWETREGFTGEWLTMDHSHDHPRIRRAMVNRFFTVAATQGEGGR